ncbi:N-acetyltransferase [Staphylococcus chromogenes]|uniref:Lipid II:glycine glycyltransferase n=1 Tax=Staphylococcus chromogenes TaxID=46126 RepID=A0AAX0ZHB7_STACR|nr:lipid II:glycine glycyltransferase FemX [Staphylococcus chromogenes]KDP12726.1 tRNA-dependent lipid II--glycine ligase (FmhB) [Staphylococcus chromogenes MU 970]MBV5137430.1 lipid II:glycine glycyltransferase FemX [Staphylococcus chromogenes]MBW6088307.1 lipid II:glycine glycyltransferase FemX [Staphylococcus chromogenes]MCD9059796.1 lipid II:glycine glycyltransferase FemX [Staphylococcus chromogenes]MCD9061942.1 lipid II:glycine glycyltransferase FemX [Staphylococcus chromogenes]
MKLMNITDQEHDAFVKEHPNGDLLQLTKWGETKKLTGWYAKRIAVGENGEIKGVAQLLFKKIPRTPFTLCYASRGFVVDYTNKLAVKVLLAEAIKIAKQEKSYTIKIDPDVEVDEDSSVVDELKALGFRHKGFKQGLSKDYIQPRMTMITPLDQTDEELIKSFDNRNRSKVRLALKRGTKVERKGREDLKIFAQLMKETGERDGFLTRDVSYFETIYDALHEDGDAELFLVKLEPKPVLKELRQERQSLDQEEARLKAKKQDKKTLNKINDVKNKQNKTDSLIQDLEQLEKTHPEGRYLSGALLMFCGHKSYYLYGASSNDYRDFLPNHHMQFKMMQYAREKGAKTYDFGGTDNQPDKNSSHYGLWTFKKAWGTYLSEKIGEFDFVLNPIVYKAVEQFKPQLTQLKIKIVRKIKKLLKYFKLILNTVRRKLSLS